MSKVFFLLWFLIDPPPFLLDISGLSSPFCRSLNYIFPLFFFHPSLIASNFLNFAWSACSSCFFSFFFSYLDLKSFKSALQIFYFHSIQIIYIFDGHHYVIK